MFLHLFLNRLKSLLRDRVLLFWTLFFPLLLSTLFFFAFGNLTKSETFSPVEVAVINDTGYQTDDVFRQVLASVSEGEEALFHLTVAQDEEQARLLLEENKIKGYIQVDAVPSLTVRDNGLSQSIIKLFLDEYIQNAQTIAHLLAVSPEAVNNGLLERLGDRTSYTREVSFSDAEPDTTLNYFYSLLAMACLYGGFWGIRNIMEIQPNMTPLGARRCVAPTHKMKAILSDALATITVHFLEILLLLAYLAIVLKIDFGNQLGYILLTCLTGCIAGISLGTFLCSVLRKSEGINVAVFLSISMTGSFLSGMMYGEMRNIVARNVPILSYLNPASLITDAFYSLYIFETHDRFFLNIGILSVISILLCIGSYFMTRRQKYASI